MNTKKNALNYIERQFSKYGYSKKVIEATQRLFEFEYKNISRGSDLSLVSCVVMALLLKYYGIDSEVQGGYIGGWNERDQRPFGSPHCWLKVKDKIIDFGIWYEFACDGLIKLNHPLILEDMIAGSEDSGIIGPGVFTCIFDKSGRRVLYQNTGFSDQSGELSIQDWSVTKYIMQCAFDLVVSIFCFAVGTDYSYRNRELVIELSEGMYFPKADNNATETTG